MPTSLLETARDSHAIRWLAGEILGVGAVHALASRIYGGLGSIVVLHRVVPTSCDLVPLPGFGGEIDVSFLRQILLFCRQQAIDTVSLDEVADRRPSARGST